MKNVEKISGNLIEGIYTKFYYIGKNLCYQIVVNYDKGKILYRDFKDYTEYQNYHKRLIEALNRKKEVDADFVMLDPKRDRLAANG